MEHDKPLVSFLRRNGAAILLTAGLFAVFYCAAYRLTRVRSDYFLHCLWAMEMTAKSMLRSFVDGSERLWHILVNLTANYLITDMFKASAAVTALADAGAFFLVFKTFDAALPQKTPRWLPALIIAAPFVVSSITVPGGGLYAGVGAVNTWHNPTNIMVRPLAAAVFYMTVRIYNRQKCGEHAVLVLNDGGFSFEGGFFAQFKKPVYTRAELILYPVCLLLSVYAKPSFLQFFAPAIFLFLLIDLIRTKGMLLPFCIKLALAYIPAAIILVMALRGFFPSGASVASVAAEAAAETESASGIAIYFIAPSFARPGDFLLSLADALKSLVLPCAFPIAIFLIGGRQGDTRSMAGLAAWCVLAAYLETLLFHETGSRAAHGNFLWGMYLASWLAWTAAAGQYALYVREKTRRGRLALYIGTPLLAWHLVCGVTYLVLIFKDGNYYI